MCVCDWVHDTPSHSPQRGRGPVCSTGRGCGAAGAGRDGLGRRFGDGSAGFHLSQREVKSDSTGPSEDFQFIPRNKTAGKYMQNKKNLS